MKRTAIVILFAALFIILSLFGTLAGIYTDFLWFLELNFSAVFMKVLLTKVVLFLVPGIIFLIFIYLNIRLAARLAPKYAMETENQIVILNPPIANKMFTPVLLGISLFFSFIMASAAKDFWQNILRYLNAVSFGSVDPIFGRDISFYVFRLPFLRQIYGWLLAAIAITTLATALAYFLYRGIVLGQMGFHKFAPHVKAHLSVLFGLFFIVLSWGYVLREYALLYSARGAAFGASYADVYAQLPIYRLMVFVAIAIAIIFILNIRYKGWRLPIIGMTILVLSTVLSGIYPAAVQQYVVSPNELDKESKYISLNIKHTTEAYGLDKVVEKEMPAADDLTLEDLENNEDTVRNIRLWDWRPLKTTFGQIQEIRPYYVFNDVDVDRYKFNGSFEAVTLSARELSTDRLPQTAKTWVNEHLVFTHGYGLCLNPVNKVTSEGMPELYVKDIPPKMNVDLDIDRPEIYYGEVNDTYIIVKIKPPTKELDYPKGDKNEYTTYEGKGGIPISSTLKKAAFSARFGSLKLLLSDAVSSQSRIIFRRTIKSRVGAVAPFLSYDSDPYLVVSQGKLYWILDAYTKTDMYPYSTPTGDFNYVRNSVKVVMDAYNGDLSFYIFDESDPMVKCYQKIFPDLFKSASSMSSDLRSHIRYPIDLMMTQARMYATFHMTDPQVFYNKEDQWAVPREIYGETDIEMEPYYIIVKLMGEEKEEFLLMLPFTPARKDNMIAWMSARCDEPNYGQILVYKFPKDKLVFGPMQIEARVNQDPDISRELTLWGQGGSKVIRGNLLVIPIEDSLFYVEPLYLQAEQGELPELKRVIFGYGNKIVMEDTLEDAMLKVFGEAKPTEPEEVEVEEEVSIEGLIKSATEHFNKAQEYQREGDWAGYGEEIEKLQEVLADLEREFKK
ncbi:UPF0182 family protein [Candidatus Oleimmundimicrobium sp.]|uniref:UPF0182 family membrane protein n=1 Tax=Candidatus Oleimmundimicrobium sp. TaxID=3060597 RepID=UPI002719DA4C|nr:UPF0182 family protein [Candidatus Oleimmundimicrobium sp.]MDO8886871.1 UPF0182 family protein [Candidatus Oleimmundimicrobium sp.]